MKITKQEQIPLTKEHYAKLLADRDTFETELEEVKIRLQTAREMGDLSENGAYKYAKFEISDINRRLRQIRHLLTYGVIHIPKKQSIIDFGSTIELKTPNGMIMSYTLVSEHESDPAKHKLSLKSPIGQATLGKKAGDQISVNTPSGTKTFIITKVS